MFDMTIQSNLSGQEPEDGSWIVPELHDHNRLQRTIGQRLRQTFNADSILMYRQEDYGRLIILHDGESTISEQDYIPSIGMTSDNPPTESLTPHKEIMDGIFLNSASTALDNNINNRHRLAARISIQNAKYFVAMDRNSIAPPFDGSDVHNLQNLLPSLRKAFSHREETTSDEKQLKSLGIHADLRDVNYIVDHTMSVLWTANKKLSVPILWVRAYHDSTRLEATDTYVQERLTTLIDKATQASSPEGGLILTEQARVLVTPLESKNHGPLVAIAVSDFHSTLSETCKLARQLYDLTPAETTLCRSLLLGRSSQEHADTSGVKVSTVRSHLKSLLLKTETIRQGQLISLLFRLSRGLSMYASKIE